MLFESLVVIKAIELYQEWKKGPGVVESFLNTEQGKRHLPEVCEVCL